MIEYDPGMSFFEWVSWFSHSTVRKVVSRLEFWTFVAIHFCTWYWKDPAEMEVTDARFSLSWNATSILGSMSTFLLAFYVNLVFTRYGQIYVLLRLLFDGAFNFVWEMKIHCKATDSKWLLLCTRYLAASLMIVIYDLRSVRGEVPEKEWEQLVAMQLLVPEEVIVLRPLLRQQAGSVALHWAARAARDFGHQASLPVQLFGSLCDHISNVRYLQQQTLDSVGFLLPFPYFHFVNLSFVVNLGFLAYAYALMTSVFAPVGFVISLVVFAATIELNANFADPLRHREMDFPIRPWLAQFVSDIMNFQGFDGAADEHARCHDHIWLRLAKSGRGYPCVVDPDHPAEEDNFWMRQDSAADDSMEESRGERGEDEDDDGD